MNDQNPRLSVLVVDDQSIFRDLHKARLSSFLDKNNVKHDISTAEGMKSALKIAKNKHLDIMLTDLQMDDQCDCGLQLSRKLSELSPSVKIFIFTNSDITSLRKKAVSVGVTECFQMPMEESHLQAIFNGRLPLKIK